MPRLAAVVMPPPFSDADAIGDAGSTSPSLPYLGNTRSGPESPLSRRLYRLAAPPARRSPRTASIAEAYSSPAGSMTTNPARSCLNRGFGIEKIPLN